MPYNSVFSIAQELSNVLAETDRTMASVKDLFGDDPMVSYMFYNLIWLYNVIHICLYTLINLSVIIQHFIL